MNTKPLNRFLKKPIPLAICCLFLLAQPAVADADQAPPSAAPPAAAATNAPPAPATDAQAPAEVTPPPVLTPEQEAIAKRHYEAGEQAYREHKYEIALDEFTSTYEIMKHPDLLYNLHKAALKLGQKDMALNYLREYKRQRPAEAETIDKEIAQLSAADIKPEPPLPVTPPPPVTPPVPAQPEAPSGPPRTSGHALLGIGGVFAVTGAALLISSAVVSQDGAAEHTRYQGLVGTGIALAGTGALALVGGIVITLKSRAPARVSLGSGARPLLAGRF